MEYIENYNEFYKLLKNYTNVFYKNLLINYSNNYDYLEMLYVKGLLLLKNIYILLHFYCETINEVIVIVEKAYIYYIEFLIQINLNSMNLELTFRDAVLFTYKRTLLSYTKQSTNNIIKEKINKELDTCLNILCNIFYLNNNINFIDHTKEQITNDVNTINSFVIKKLNTIEQLENKLKKYITNNINLSQFNTILLRLRDSVEKKFKDYSNNKINNKLHYLLDNYKINESNITNDELLLD
jgi:hypothetical protein